VGRGSTFRIELPVLSGPAPAPSVPAREADEAGSRRSRALEILLVEDHVDTSRVLRRLLENAGHRVTTVGSVGQLAEVGERVFDLLISDIGLPDGSGLDVVRQMRPQVLRAVALSGYGMAEDVERSRGAGFDEHLTKPIDFGKLERIVREMSVRGKRAE
jgi:CheY-like chemotaxis protein